MAGTRLVKSYAATTTLGNNLCSENQKKWEFQEGINSSNWKRLRKKGHWIKDFGFFLRRRDSKIYNVHQFTDWLVPSVNGHCEGFHPGRFKAIKLRIKSINPLTCIWGLSFPLERKIVPPSPRFRAMAWRCETHASISKTRKTKLLAESSQSSPMLKV